MRMNHLRSLTSLATLGMLMAQNDAAPGTELVVLAPDDGASAPEVAETPAKKTRKPRAKKASGKKAKAAKAAVKGKKSIVPDQYKKKYGKDQNCGDELASVMAETVNDEKGRIDLPKLNKVGKANQIDVETRWTGLNPGQQRMNLGNVLRHRIERGEYVVVGEQVWNSEAKGQKTTKTPAKKAA